MDVKNPRELDPDLGVRDLLADAVLAEATFDGWNRASLASATRRLDLPNGDRVSELIERDPRICCVADEHASYYEIRGVIVHASATRADRGDSAGDSVVASVDSVISVDFGRLR